MGLPGSANIKIIYEGTRTLENWDKAVRGSEPQSGLHSSGITEFSYKKTRRIEMSWENALDSISNMRGQY